MLFKQSKLKRYYKKAKSMYEYRQNNQVSDAILKKEIDLYMGMAAIYDLLVGCKKFPHAKLQAIENIRAAAEIGDVNAQYEVGERLYHAGKFWYELQSSIYKARSQQKYMDTIFLEAYGYFEMAGTRGMAKANRMRGVMMINGWGCDRNTETGLKLIVDSIEQEGAWERSTQIFGELGLNKPEFFSAIMTMRKS